MAEASNGSDVAVDGRTARAIRTRDALVDATMALVEEGDLRPTAPRIAERAGVSVRTVFQHFDDLESLFALIGDRAFAKAAEVAAPIDASSPLDERIELFVEQRSRLNEMMTPVNRAALLQQPTSQTITRQFAHGHQMASARVAMVFAREIAAAGTAGDALLDGLRIVTGWGTWNTMRGIERRSFDEARAAMDRLVRIVLGGAGFPDR